MWHLWKRETNAKTRLYLSLYQESLYLYYYDVNQLHLSHSGRRLTKGIPVHRFFMKQPKSNTFLHLLLALSLMMGSMQGVVADFDHASADRNVAVAGHSCDSQVDAKVEAPNETQSECCCSENCAFACLMSCSSGYHGAGLTVIALTIQEFSLSVLYAGMEQTYVGIYLPPPHRPPREAT